MPTTKARITRFFRFRLRTLLAFMLIMGPVSFWFGPPIVENARAWMTPQKEETPTRRTEQLIFTSEDFRNITEEWERYWYLEQPEHGTPERVHGGILE